VTVDANPLVVHLTDGTAAASGTVTTLTLGAGESPSPYDLGAGKMLTAGNTLGIKTDSGAGTVAGQFGGRYLY